MNDEVLAAGGEDSIIVEHAGGSGDFAANWMAFRTFVTCMFASGEGAEEHDKK